MPVSVRVKLVGIFRVLSGRSQVMVRLGKGATIRDVVQKLVEASPAEFGEAFVDRVLSEPRPDALVLVNGREIGVLGGVGTLVGDDDEVVFVPVAHGG